MGATWCGTPLSTREGSGSIRGAGRKVSGPSMGATWCGTPPTQPESVRASCAIGIAGTLAAEVASTVPAKAMLRPSVRSGLPTVLCAVRFLMSASFPARHRSSSLVVVRSSPDLRGSRAGATVWSEGPPDNIPRQTTLRTGGQVQGARFNSDHDGTKGSKGGIGRTLRRVLTAAPSPRSSGAPLSCAASQPHRAPGLLSRRPAGARERHDAAT